jgi:hypothetical protein
MPDVSAILAERNKQHGSLVDQAHICQAMKDVMRASIGWDAMAPDQREAADMIVHKLARALSGDPNHIDHWTDVSGYARLVANRLEQAHV